MPLVRVEAPHFTAGIVLDAAGLCVASAPILRRSVGRHRDVLSAHYKAQGWKASVVKVITQEQREAGPPEPDPIQDHPLVAAIFAEWPDATLYVDVPAPVNSSNP